MPMPETQARIAEANTVLLLLSAVEDLALLENFCGTVLTPADLLSRPLSVSNKTVYLCGDIARAGEIETTLEAAARVFVVRELSRYDDSVPWPVVDVGRVPVLVHGVGVLYRRFFDPDLDLGSRVRAEHTFQSLTESNKSGTAHRTGLYLTPVEQKDDELHFRLLRCSSNFSGPTENFRATDSHIVDALNDEAAEIFENPAPLNHVLAQIYWNTPATAGSKQTKAKIKGHADKTKDMPGNAVIAFCTFYDQLDKLAPLAADPFDRGYKRTSGLSRLHFRLKPMVAQRPACTLQEQFSVTLYPNSVFFMPLSTNRLYTHEIRTSQLNAEQLPTRLGYVVRCSSRAAVYKSGHTCLEIGGAMVDLEPRTPDGADELRRLYAQENRTDDVICYGDGFVFSMNEGDYAKPGYEAESE